MCLLQLQRRRSAPAALLSSFCICLWGSVGGEESATSVRVRLASRGLFSCVLATSASLLKVRIISFLQRGVTDRLS